MPQPPAPDLLDSLGSAHRELEEYLSDISKWSFLGTQRTVTLSDDIDFDFDAESRYEDGGDPAVILASAIESCHGNISFDSHPWSRFQCSNDGELTRALTVAEASATRTPAHELSPPSLCATSRTSFSSDTTSGYELHLDDHKNYCTQDQQVESLLLSTPGVTKVCLVRPVAGLFEGQLVAFLTRTAMDTSDESPITLLSENEHLDAQKHIQNLKLAVLEWGCDTHCPDVWVPLQTMALDGYGEPEARKLQTWIQNVTEKTANTIMAMQVIKHQPRWSEQRRESKLNTSQPCGATYDQVDAEEHQCESRALGHRVDELFPLAAMQRLFFRPRHGRDLEESVVNDPEHRFNQSMLFKVNGDIGCGDIKVAMDALISRHAMLRARFRLTAEGWVQTIESRSDLAYRFSQIYFHDNGDVLRAINEAQRSLNICRGPVFAATCLQNTENCQLLYLVVHHLVVDSNSWDIMLNDLEQLLRGVRPASPHSMPYMHWARLQSYDRAQHPIDSSLPLVVNPASLEYWGLENQSNLFGDTTHLSFSLSPSAASVLKGCNDVFRTESADVFLAALLFSFHEAFFDRPTPTVWKLEPGRDLPGNNSNVAGTVGWFTALCPISVPVGSRPNLIQLIKLIKDTRRAVLLDGVSFFQSTFASDNTAAKYLPVEIMFNCIENPGQLQKQTRVLEPVATPDRLFHTLASVVGPAVSRIALFEVSVAVDEYGIRAGLSFNRNSRHQNRIKQWMDLFKRSITDSISSLRMTKLELPLADAPLLATTYTGLSNFGLKRLAEMGIYSVENVETICPTHFLQEEILVAQSIDHTCFHLSRTYELVTIDGSIVDRDVLCTAWKTLTASHSVLRSVFIDGISEARLFDQVILKKISPDMLFMESDNPREALQSLPPMKLSKNKPNHRLSVGWSGKSTYLRFDFSQALCDLTSIQTLALQLRELYTILTSATPTPLPIRPVRQIASLDPPGNAEAWQSHLHGATPCIFPHITIQSQGRLQSQNLQLGISYQQLSEFCTSNQVSMSTVFKLGWALVLRTYVGKDSVIFGFSHAYRHNVVPIAEPYIGSLAMPIPCLVEFSSVTSMLDLIRYLERRDTELSMAGVPTSAEIEHSLGIGAQRLFNTCLICQFTEDTTLGPLYADYGAWEPILLANSIDENCDVSLCLTLCGINIQVDVSHSCFSSEQLYNVMNTFQYALQAIIDTSGQLCSEVDLFTGHDLQQIMNPNWRRREQPRPETPACLHHLILKECERRPDSPAIHAWDGLLSYHELAVTVSSLAAYLIDKGVYPGALVPVVLEKSCWSPVIMLAVMQAGGCLVCLDAQDMLMVELTLSQLEPELVIVTGGASEHTRQFGRTQVSVNETFLSSLPQKRGLPINEILPQQAACAFLTPGAKEPEGVIFTHASLSLILSAQGLALKICESSRVLQLSAYTVDVAIVEILGTLLHGGCVCIPSALERANDLEGTITRMGITWTYMTTVLSRKINPLNVLSLKSICFRTRTLDRETYEPWLSGRDVLLAYGASNICPLAISVHKIADSTDTSIIPPPLIGRFIILDPDDSTKLMPLGAVGELAIDSPLIIPHRYTHNYPHVGSVDLRRSDSGSYLRTGYRARYLDQGYIRLLDPQPQIADLQNEMRQILGGDIDVIVEPITTYDTMHLPAAFLEFGDREFVGRSELDKLSMQMRSKLTAARWLVNQSLAESPKYRNSSSVPLLMIPVRRFPLSTSLKVNRKKLQKLVAPFTYTELLELADTSFAGRPCSTIFRTKPLHYTKREKSLISVWADVLQVKVANVKNTDCFLDVGGDNVLARRLVQCCRKFDLDISINEVLGGATLTELCQSLEIKKGRLANPLEIRPKAGAVTRTTPRDLDKACIHRFIAPQLNIDWNDIIDISEASSHQLQCLEPSLYGPRTDVRHLIINFKGPIAAQRVEQACSALTRLHLSLRTGFAVHGSGLLQVAIHSFHADFQKKTIVTPSFEEETQKVLRNWQRELPQLQRPATRFAFLDAGQYGAELMMQFSQAQVSGFAVPILLKDLISLYEQPTVDLRRDSFFDYTRALRGPGYNEGLLYWKKHLQTAKASNLVTHSKPYLPVSKVESIQEEVDISPLADFGITFDSVLKAAWAMVMATLHDSPDVVFGELIEGHRCELEAVDTSSLAGPIESIVPVRVWFPTVPTSPLQILQLIQLNSATSRPFEAIGEHQIIQNCTDWVKWSRFSTIVCHRDYILGDGITTMNIDSTPFTYSILQPQIRRVPEFLVSSTTMSASKVSLHIEYSPSHIAPQVAREAMSLLIASIQALTCRKTLNHLILPTSGNMKTSLTRTIFTKRQLDTKRPSYSAHHLSLPKRHALEQLLIPSWNEILFPETKQPLVSDLYHTRFYDISGSLFPAYLLAQRLNRGLRTIKIDGINSVNVTAADIINAPTITDQVELVSLKMKQREATNKSSTKGRTFSIDADFSSHKKSLSTWTVLGKKIHHLHHSRPSLA